MLETTVTSCPVEVRISKLKTPAVQAAFVRIGAITPVAGPVLNEPISVPESWAPVASLPARVQTMFCGDGNGGDGVQVRSLQAEFQVWTVFSVAADSL